jgi:hypothetical protein
MFMHQHHEYGRELDPFGYSGQEFNITELFPNEGLDVIFGVIPKGGTTPANTWLGLFTANTASAITVTSAAVIASWSEATGTNYARQTIAAASWGTVGTTQSGRGTASAQLTFTSAGTTWGTVNGFMICSGSGWQAGVVYFGANFDDVTAVAVNTGDIVKVTPTWVYTG